VGTYAEPSVGPGTQFQKIFQTGIKQAVVEKRLLAVFIVTCVLGLDVVSDLFQLHVHSVIPCLCSLPTEPSPEGLQLGDYVCAGGLTFYNLTKNLLVYSVSYFNFWGLVAFWGG